MSEKHTPTVDAYDVQEILRCVESTAVKVFVETGHDRTLYHKLAQRWGVIMEANGVTRYGPRDEKFALVPADAHADLVAACEAALIEAIGWEYAVKTMDPKQKHSPELAIIKQLRAALAKATAGEAEGR